MQISFSLINDSYGLNSQGVTTRVLYVCMVLSPRFLEWNPFYQNQGNRVKGIRSCWQRMYSRFRYMQRGSVWHSRQAKTSCHRVLGSSYNRLLFRLTSDRL